MHTVSAPVLSARKKRKGMLVLVRRQKVSLPSRKLGRCVALVLSAGVASSVSAEDRATSELDKVTVTATRVEALSYDVPASISSISADNFRDASLGVNLADDVAEVPGLLARNRNNYAQDQQISIRGYGANSAFGIRGVRIYQDGMPASSPDGQGQVSQFNLDSASHVEVLRGPFSALYGNSSGGVIQIFTADGEGPLQLRAGVAAGSFETLRAGVNASGAVGDFGYNVGFTHFQIEGYRDHSSATNESFNTKLNYSLNDSNKLTFLLNVVSRPDSDDPLGLTEAQFLADPTQVDPAALQFNTRKSLQQEQAGLVYDLEINDSHSVRVMGYYGQRSVEQFLSVTVAAQATPNSAGGVIDLEREYGGGDARWTWQGSLAGRPMSWVLGATYDRQNERRRGFNNYVGTGPSQVLGVKGTLRRDENNIVYNIDEYLQGSWDFATNWSAMIGVRHTDIEFTTEDHYFRPGPPINPDDSGQLSYDATTPVAGLMFKPLEWLHAYASYGQGFQSPLGSELAYRADGVTGLNTNLVAATSKNAELGVKMQVATNLNVEAALFQALTEDEIVINTNQGGRSTYQNSGRTDRRGAELSVDYLFASDFRLQVAYTYLEATYTDTYTTCVATPCTPANKVPVAAGNSLPGIPENSFYAALRWGGDEGLYASANFQSLSDIYVNDLNNRQAPAYEVVGADVGYRLELASFRIDSFVRVNNVLDEDYVGSIIVNDGNSRFFEPGSGTAVLAGITVKWQ